MDITIPKIPIWLITSLYGCDYDISGHDSYEECLKIVELKRNMFGLYGWKIVQTNNIDIRKIAETTFNLGKRYEQSIQKSPGT